MLENIPQNIAIAGRAFGRFLHVPVRQRYFFTRENRIRLRYVIKPVVSFTAVFAAAFITAQSGSASISPKFYSGSTYDVAYDMQPGDIRAHLEKRMWNSQKRLSRYTDGEGDAEETALISFPTRKPRPTEKTEDVEIGKGDTLAGVLQRAGISGGEAHKIVAAIQEYFDPRDMRPGQKMQLQFKPAEEGEGFAFNALDMPISPLKTLNLKRDGGGDFVTAVAEEEATQRVYAKKAVIENSLYGSALKAGIPSAVVADAIRIFSWDIDFQRDVRRGDMVEVMYDQMETNEGIKVKSGDILFARLHINGQTVPIYRYTTTTGDTDYFTPDGHSLRKALMKTPIDGARLSSGFGMRKHPVLGYNKMHKGIDFAAATGTPIYAAGDGTIEKASKWNAYGNYVRIRHNSGIKTAYAHMSKFGPGITAGKRVKQGQVIGYVGTTGRSTGPHLHYEVLVDNVQVNPKSISLPQGEILKGKELAAFKSFVSKTDQQYATLRGEARYASLR